MNDSDVITLVCVANLVVYVFFCLLFTVVALAGARNERKIIQIDDQLAFIMEYHKQLTNTINTHNKILDNILKTQGLLLTKEQYNKLVACHNKVVERLNEVKDRTDLLYTNYLNNYDSADNWKRGSSPDDDFNEELGEDV